MGERSSSFPDSEVASDSVEAVLGGNSSRDSRMLCSIRLPRAPPHATRLAPERDHRGH
jgi:hypothetical protein